MVVTLPGNRFVKWLCYAFTVILILNLVVVLFRYNGFLQSAGGFTIYKSFYMDQEVNLPTFFNMLLLLICSVILLVIYFIHRIDSDPTRPSWLFLAVIFLFLAIDEITSMHEFLIYFLPQRGIGGEGYLRFAWVIPYGIVTIAIFFLQIRFLLKLDRRIAVAFLCSGALYVAGALGMEIVGTAVIDTHGIHSLPTALMLTLEETLEMVGLLLFIQALIVYVRAKFPRLELQTV